ncbi:hypothetical protein [Paenibacillus algorifonticola]|uniref:hypothetical protein n=1 Tax=Paenibacillus algorifonticola TaxID=684063 RepID=UPI000619B588|nr:hypothetical protein [Paenibacillus algorifonticola]
MIKVGKKYWEVETPETIEFGNNFMRCYDKAGKLQFGIKLNGNYIVKFVIDRKELFADNQAADYLRALLNEWEDMVEEQGDDD